METTKQITTKAKLLSFILVLAIFFSSGCKKEINEGFPRTENKIAEASNPKNPYSVLNMRKTLATLLVGDVQLTNANKLNHVKGKVMFSPNGENIGIFPKMSMNQGLEIAQKGISASHYYIKFMPRNDADLSKLRADSSLTFYPFPLDNEYKQYPADYHDPSVPIGVPTYQYASVPVGYALPDVPYVKMEELYIPDTRNPKNTINLRAANNSSYAISAVEMVALAECGNEAPIINDEELVDIIDDCGGGGGGGSYPPGDPYRSGENWRPNGRITVYDEVLQQTIGVEGLEIRARRWFTTYKGITDANGYYAVDGWFTRPANYWTEFERYDFSVNDHSGGPQEIDGPKIEAAWNHELTGYDKFCSTIFRAAYHYYYKDIQGLRRPPQNGFWKTQMKLGAFNETNTDANGDHAPARRFLGLGEAIHIYNPNRSSEEIYATTIHELGHAGHWDMAASDYRNADDNVSESWSVGVQWVLTKMTYPDYDGRPNGTPNYTNVVMDMIDSSDYANTKTAPNGGYWTYGTGIPTDQVKNYNIVQIQDALIGARNIYQWKNNLLYNYENVTENYLDTLFNYWANQ